MLRLEDLRRNLKLAMRGVAGVKVVAPRVTAAQVAQAEALLAALQRGAPATFLPQWELTYNANNLPESSTPAWTRYAQGHASVAGGVLTLEGS